MYTPRCSSSVTDMLVWIVWASLYFILQNSSENHPLFFHLASCVPPHTAFCVCVCVRAWWRSVERNTYRQSVPSTHDGAALVVPATCPGKQEHFTVWDRSSILFLLQQRCSATTSQVPVRTWCAAGEKTGEMGSSAVVKMLLPSCTKLLFLTESHRNLSPGS